MISEHHDIFNGIQTYIRIFLLPYEDDLTKISTMTLKYKRITISPFHSTGRINISTCSAQKGNKYKIYRTTQHQDQTSVRTTKTSLDHQQHLVEEWKWTDDIEFLVLCPSVIIYKSIETYSHSLYHAYDWNILISLVYIHDSQLEGETAFTTTK